MLNRVLSVLLGALLLLPGLALVSAAPAFACTCAALDIDQQATRADVVFVAEVEDVTEAGRNYEYSLVATHAYQGTVERETTVTSARQESACGLGELRPGTDYVFFATGEQAPYAADSCGGSGSVSAKRLTEIERALGAGEAIAAPEPPAPTMTRVEDSPPAPLARLAAPGGALALIGLLGLLVVGRLGRSG